MAKNAKTKAATKPQTAKSKADDTQLEKEIMAFLKSEGSPTTVPELPKDLQNTRVVVEKILRLTAEDPKVPVEDREYARKALIAYSGLYRK
jgi:hypothetical protein